MVAITPRYKGEP